MLKKVDNRRPSVPYVIDIQTNLSGISKVPRRACNDKAKHDREKSAKFVTSCFIHFFTAARGVASEGESAYV